jgi:putative DNA primase/helicase
MNTFKMIDGNLYVVKSREGEKNYDHLISSQIDILADTRNLQGEEWGRLLQWKDKDNVAHMWYMPMEALVDSKVLLSTLLNGGLPYLSTAYDDRALLKEYIQTWPVKRTLRTTTKIGWHGKAFVLPGEVINGDETGEELVLTKDLKATGKLPARPSNGRNT